LREGGREDRREGGRGIEKRKGVAGGRHEQAMAVRGKNQEEACTPSFATTKERGEKKNK
jgi:hypothetical protein